jgi:hypothetical protein
LQPVAAFGSGVVRVVATAGDGSRLAAVASAIRQRDGRVACSSASACVGDGRR